MSADDIIIFEVIEGLIGLSALVILVLYLIDKRRKKGENHRDES